VEGAFGRVVVEEDGTNKPITARYWPALEPFSVRKSLKPFKLFPLRSKADGDLAVEGAFGECWKQGACLRLIPSCITQRKAQGPSRTCSESNEEGEGSRRLFQAPETRSRRLKLVSSQWKVPLEESLSKKLQMPNKTVIDCSRRQLIKITQSSNVLEDN